jgi:ankyrin repeat protein
MSKYIFFEENGYMLSEYFLSSKDESHTNKKEDPFILVHTGNHKALSLMIKKGMSVHLRNEKDQTLFHYAILYDQVKIAHLLKANGATLNSSDKFGQTPKDVISYKNTPELLKLLFPYEEQEISYTNLSGEEDTNSCCTIF